MCVHVYMGIIKYKSGSRALYILYYQGGQTASRMLIHFKLDHQGAWPPLLYYIEVIIYYIYI